MKHQQTLTRHRDIQDWVSQHRGAPAIARVPDRYGQVRARLCLSFDKRRSAPTGAPTLDDGMSPVSWNAWLAELDRQNLALQVAEAGSDRFELVPRHDLN